MEPARNGHVQLDPNGVEWVDDTNVKVVEIALVHIARGLSSEEIHRQYPHISLAQAYAALAYYHDHKPRFDAEIERSYGEYRARRDAAGDSPLRRKLRALGHLA
jgi:uncharacterized protein (DUF433 family)